MVSQLSWSLVNSDVAISAIISLVIGISPYVLSSLDLPQDV